MLPPSGRDATGRAFGKPTQSVRARNNRLRSCSCPHVFRGMGDGCGGLKVGTEMSGGVSDVIFEHNRIDYAGIAIKLSAPTPRGGVVKNITWTDLDIRNSGMVIGIDVNLAGSDPKEPSPPPPDVALVADVTFANIVARNLSCCEGCVDYGCDAKARSAGWLQAGPFKNVDGWEGIHGVTFSNISVLGHTPSDSPLSWLCSEKGAMSGKASGMVPPLSAGCVGGV